MLPKNCCSCSVKALRLIREIDAIEGLEVENSDYEALKDADNIISKSKEIQSVCEVDLQEITTTVEKHRNALALYLQNKDASAFEKEFPGITRDRKAIMAAFTKAIHEGIRKTPQKYYDPEYELLKSYSRLEHLLINSMESCAGLPLSKPASGWEAGED
jgi:hypothetical protein